MTLKEIIAQAASTPRKRVKVDMPEWGTGVSVYVCEMTTAEQNEMQVFAASNKDNTDLFQSKYLLFTLQDENGSRLTPDDLKVMATIPAKSIDKLFRVAADLNAVLPADVDAMEKNS